MKNDWEALSDKVKSYNEAIAELRGTGPVKTSAPEIKATTTNSGGGIIPTAEEIAKDIDDHPDADSVNKITNNQINFIDTLSSRLNINVTKLLESNNLDSKNIYGLSHDAAVSIIRVLSGYQQNMVSIPDTLIGYSNEWK
jgi:hypothetical protein